MRFRVAAALDSEELERVFEDGVVDGRMDMERGRGVRADDDEVFALLGKLGEVRAREELGLVAYGILRAEFVDARDGVERTVDPDVRLDGLADIRSESAEFLFSAVRVDDGKLGADGNVGHVGVLVVLGTEPCLVQTYRAPVVDIQRIEVTAFAGRAGAVDIREGCNGSENLGTERAKENS